MKAARIRNAYQQSESQAQIHPAKLIHLMYERVLLHLEQAEKGVMHNDIKLRGENLSKAIAIITELSASIKEGDDSEASEFLRGLYSAILIELPKVSLNQDVEIIRQSIRYIDKLKGIWEKTVLPEAGLSVAGEKVDKQPAKAVPVPEQEDTEIEQPSMGKGRYGQAGSGKVSVYSQALSVSI